MGKKKKDLGEDRQMTEEEFEQFKLECYEEEAQKIKDLSENEDNFFVVNSIKDLPKVIKKILAEKENNNSEIEFEPDKELTNLINENELNKNIAKLIESVGVFVKELNKFVNGLSIFLEDNK